jgi:hypothetical protein
MWLATKQPLNPHPTPCVSKHRMLITQHKGIFDAHLRTSHNRSDRHVRTAEAIQRGPVSIRDAVRTRFLQQTGDKRGGGLWESGPIPSSLLTALTNNPPSLARFPPGASCQHSCLCRVRRSTLKAAQGRPDLSLPFKRRAGRGRRPLHARLTCLLAAFKRLH